MPESKTLSQHMFEIVDLFNYPKDRPNPYWHLVEHRCPRCKGVVATYGEWEWVETYGFCLTCDKLMAEVLEENLGGELDER